MTLSTTLIRSSNIVLRLFSETSETKKFQAFRIDTQNPVEVLQTLEIPDISVEDSAKFFEHPLEDGSTIVDHVIFDPNSVNFDAYISIDDAQSLQELEFLYKNSIPLKVRTENKVIERCAIASKPFKVSSTHFDKDIYSISIKEAPEVLPVYVSMPKAQNKSNVSRVKSGVKQAKKVEKKKSWLKSAFLGGRT